MLGLRLPYILLMVSIIGASFDLQAAVHTEPAGIIIPFSDQARENARPPQVTPLTSSIQVQELPAPSVHRSGRAIDKVLTWAELGLVTQRWSSEQKRDLVQQAATLPMADLKVAYPQLDAEDLSTLSDLVRGEKPE